MSNTTVPERAVDPHAGTVYRDLHDAEEAVRMAQYYGQTTDGIGYDPALARAEINTALVVLTAARDKLEGAAA